MHTVRKEVLDLLDLSAAAALTSIYRLSQDHR